MHGATKSGRVVLTAIQGNFGCEFASSTAAVAGYYGQAHVDACPAAFLAFNANGASEGIYDTSSEGPFPGGLVVKNGSKM